MTAYEIALAASREAAAIFFEAQAAFAAKKIGYAEYGAAIDANRVANAAFDVAFAIEEARVENEITSDDAGDDDQLSLFA